MIQRIQTVYLLISTGLMSALFFLPLAEYNLSDGSTMNLFYNGLIIVGKGIQMATIPITILLVLNILLNLISIFLYKNRKLQMRICIYNLILMIGLFGLLFYYYKFGIEQLKVQIAELVSMRMLWTSILPVISAFFLYLAYKGVLKDELLIKSIDRLR